MARIKNSLLLYHAFGTEHKNPLPPISQLWPMAERREIQKKHVREDNDSPSAPSNYKEGAKTSHRGWLYANDNQVVRALG